MSSISARHAVLCVPLSVQSDWREVLSLWSTQNFLACSELVTHVRNIAQTHVVAQSCLSNRLVPGQLSCQYVVCASAIAYTSRSAADMKPRA